MLLCPPSLMLLTLPATCCHSCWCQVRGVWGWDCWARVRLWGCGVLAMGVWRENAKELCAGRRG